MSELELIIWGSTQPCLEEIFFRDSITNQTRKLVRGRVSPTKGGSSFHFTSAVHAFAVLALRQAAFPTGCVGLTGIGSSPALSLEYAILRKPSWILDLFGVDSNGDSLVLRYFHRTNAGFKRAAPLKVSLNPALLAPQNISCTANGRRVTVPDELALLADYFEARWLERADAKTSTSVVNGESL